MRISLIRLAPFVMTIVILAIPPEAKAQAWRTWVSGVGDDTNPCSRTLPCKTFAGAISRTAMGGEINCLTSGGFGAITITKSVTIDGTGCEAGILGSPAQGITINITATADTAKTVRLRRLSLNGLGLGISANGIDVFKARRVFLDEVLIDGFSGDGVSVVTDSTELFVNNTIIRNVGKMGINIVPKGTAPRITLFAERTTLTGTFTALSVGKGGWATIRDSSIFANQNGLVADGSELNAISCVLTENEIAITVIRGSIMRLSEVEVINNRLGLQNLRGRIVAFNHVLIHGNQIDGAPSTTIPTP